MSDQNQGLAKAAPSPTQEAIPTQTGPIEQAFMEPLWAGVPMSVLRHFGLDLKADESTLSQVREVYRMVDVEDKTPGKVLQKLSDLEVQMGVPRIGETRYGRLYNYLRMGSAIKDMQRQQGALINGTR